VVGVINIAPVLEGTFDGFKLGMTELGYSEGETIIYMYTGPAGSIAGLEEAAQVLLEAEVDLVLAISTPATQIMQQVVVEADKTIPIVFAPVTDPVEAGIVASLKEPGGNITGIKSGGDDERRLEFLLEIDPTIEHIYIPYNSNDNSPLAALKVIEEAAKRLQVELILQPTTNDEAVMMAIKNLPAEADAVFLLPDALLVSYMDDFVALTLEHKLPLSVSLDRGVAAGALYSYSFSGEAMGKQAARLADLILQGASPANLPVERAEFFFTINLKTAQAINLPISEDILQQAHEIIR
jgi:putative ABC transport system substrate-binding protein